MATEERKQLSVQLAESSGMFARSALHTQHTDDRVYLLHAATALEHLAKAVLAARHPSFIVPANDFDSLLHACGEPARPDRRSRRMKTIGAQEAVDRVGHFVTAVAPLTSELKLLVDVRNGVAHLGEVEADDADRVLVPYLKASEALRDALGIDRSLYWGEFNDLVDTALKENVVKARLRVETALANARQEFERRFGELDEKTKGAMLGLIESGYRLQKYEEQLRECPACDTPAYIYGAVEVEYDEDWDYHERVLLNVHPYFTFVPQSFGCNACGLELNGRDELDAAGIAGSWTLEDVDPRDFFDGEDF